MKACDLSTQEEAAGGSKAQGQLLPHSTFEASLDYMRLCLRNQDKKNTKSPCGFSGDLSGSHFIMAWLLGHYLSGSSKREQEAACWAPVPKWNSCGKSEQEFWKQGEGSSREEQEAHGYKKQELCLVCCKPGRILALHSREPQQPRKRWTLGMCACSSVPTAQNSR